MGLNIFFEGLSKETIFTSSHQPLQYAISAIFSIFKGFITVKLDIQSTEDVTSGCLFNFSKSNYSYFIFTLHEKCPNKELYLVYVFLYSDWIQENTDQKYLCFGHFSCSVNYKFHIKSQINCSRVVFIERSNVFIAKQKCFWNFCVSL